MHGDIPDVLVAIIMLIALLPWWGGAVVAVIAGFAVRAWWRKRRATRAAQRIAERGAQGEDQPAHDRTAAAQAMLRRPNVTNEAKRMLRQALADDDNALIDELLSSNVALPQRNDGTASQPPDYTDEWNRISMQAFGCPFNEDQGARAQTDPPVDTATACHTDTTESQPPSAPTSVATQEQP